MSSHATSTESPTSTATPSLTHCCDGIVHDSKHLKDEEIAVPSGSEEALQDAYEPPDGGLHAWLTVLGASLIGFATFGFVNGFGAFVDYYKRDYLSDYSPTLISMIGSVQVFVMYILAGFAGAVFDAVGTRLLVPISGVIVVFALFMLSITQRQQIWQQYLVQSVLFNVGASFGFFPGMAIVSHWFRKNAPYALGVVAAGASCGGIVFPIMLQYLIPRIGFGWSVRTLAFVVMLCYIIATLTIRERRPTKPLPPLSKLLDLAAFKEPCYAFLALGSWFSIFALFNPFFYLGLYARMTHVNWAVAPYLVAILCAGSAIGRVVPGIVAVHVGRFNIMVMSTLVSAILILVMWYNAQSESVIVAFAILFGLISGPFFSLMAACVSDISPIERVGARTGQVFGFMSFGAMSGTPISGIFIQSQTIENFHHLILFSGCMALVGSFFLLVSRFYRNRRLFAVA